MFLEVLMGYDFTYEVDRFALLHIQVIRLE